MESSAADPRLRCASKNGRRLADCARSSGLAEEMKTNVATFYTCLSTTIWGSQSITLPVIILMTGPSLFMVVLHW